MRAERWWQEASIVEQIFHRPTVFEFVQATRLLRHVPVIHPAKYWADDFSFESSLSLNFPEAEIESLVYEDQHIKLTNLLVGMTGIQGVLPYTYTHKIKQAPKQQRLEVLKFFSLFNHKLTAQYVDASLAYNLPIRYEIEQDNCYLNIVHGLNGYIRDQHQQCAIGDYFAEFSGLMQGQNNSAHALKTMLSCIFKVDIQITEFVIEQFKLTLTQQAKLGQSQATQLGVNSFCGEHIKQVDGKIEIVIGPLNYQQYLEFLPHAQQSEKLKSILQSWCSPTLMVDLRLILASEAIQPIQLCSHHQVGLAQASFLMTKQVTNNNETCYALMKGITC